MAARHLASGVPGPAVPREVARQGAEEVIRAEAAPPAVTALIQAVAPPDELIRDPRVHPEGEGLGPRTLTAEAPAQDEEATDAGGKPVDPELDPAQESHLALIEAKAAGDDQVDGRRVGLGGLKVVAKLLRLKGPVGAEDRVEGPKEVGGGRRLLERLRVQVAQDMRDMREQVRPSRASPNVGMARPVPGRACVPIVGRAKGIAVRRRRVVIAKAKAPGVTAAPIMALPEADLPVPT